MRINLNFLHFPEVRDHCRLIERTVISKEPRFILRVLRGLFSLRKDLSGPILKRLIVGYYTHSTEAKEALLKMIPDEVSN